MEGGLKDEIREMIQENLDETKEIKFNGDKCELCVKHNGELHLFDVIDISNRQCIFDSYTEDAIVVDDIFSEIRSAIEGKTTHDCVRLIKGNIVVDSTIMYECGYHGGVYISVSLEFNYLINGEFHEYGDIYFTIENDVYKKEYDKIKKLLTIDESGIKDIFESKIVRLNQEKSGIESEINKHKQLIGDLNVI